MTILMMMMMIRKKDAVDLHQSLTWDDEGLEGKEWDNDDIDDDDDDDDGNEERCCGPAPVTHLGRRGGRR